MVISTLKFLTHTKLIIIYNQLQLVQTWANQPARKVCKPQELVDAVCITINQHHNLQLAANRDGKQVNNQIC